MPARPSLCCPHSILRGDVADGSVISVGVRAERLHVEQRPPSFRMVE